MIPVKINNNRDTAEKDLVKNSGKIEEIQEMTVF